MAHVRSPVAPRTRTSTVAWVTFVLALVCGCGEGMQPFDYPTADVTGRATYQGRPVSGGWIEFHPEPPTVGHFTTAMIGPDGTYDARRVAVGTHRVEIVRSRPLLPPPYRTGATTLRARVLADRINRIDFHVDRPQPAPATGTRPTSAPTTRPSPPKR